jgi:hypothetical protein
MTDRKLTEQEIKEWIDNASYESLLGKWRFAISGSPYFKGEMGKYYRKKMDEKRIAIGPAAAAQASKNIGW